MNTLFFIEKFTLWINKYPLIKSLLYPFYIILGIKRHRLNEIEKPLINHGKEVLSKAKEALESINAFFWLDFGTLLGAYRDNSFIKGDSDIDISMFLDDFTPEIERAMLKYGFKKSSQIEIDKGVYGIEQTYVYKNLHVDIFYYTKKDEDLMYMHSFMPFPEYNSNIESIENMGGLLPIEQYLPYNGFKKIKYLDMEFNIPDQTSRHLSYHYGDDFMIPKKWNYMDLENDNVNARTLFNKIGINNLNL